MSHRILLTGASGYLGGTLLARWKRESLPPYEKLYALVRTDEQATAVKQYAAAAEPLVFDVKNEAAVRAAVIDNNITIVLFLIDAFEAHSQKHFIKALAEVKAKTGSDVHFLHTSGAKIFSSHAGAPIDRPLLDTEEDLYQIQKAQQPPIAPMQIAINTNNTVIEQGEALGVASYIFVPCIVYGKGEGFGNKISIQTAAIVQAARATGRVHSVDDGRPVWPVCHVLDNTSLYLEIMRSILAGERPGSGQRGYYLAASGDVAWVDLYAAMAARLASQGVIESASVGAASDEVLGKMAAALKCPKEMVALQLGGT